MAKRLCIAFVALSLLVLTALSAFSSLAPRGLGDYGSFVLAGEAYDRGWNPYAVYDGLVGDMGLDLGFDDRPYSPNLNPPISVYPFALISRVDPDVSRGALRLVSAVIYLAACRALLKAYPAQRKPLIVLWLVSAAGFWYTLWMGQLYVLLFGLGLAAWLLLKEERNPILAGVLIGIVVAIKPNFAVWPLLLLLAGHRRPAAWAFLTGLLISAIPLVIEGPQIYAQWIDAAQGYSRGAISANGSLVGTAARLGFEPLGYALGAISLSLAALYAWRVRPSAVNTSAAALIVALLMGPLSWLGYTLFALPALIARRWHGWEIAAATTLAIPAGFTAASGEVHLAGMLILGGLLAGDALRSPASQANAESAAGQVVLPEAA